MDCINLELLENSPLKTEFFPYTIVPNFIKPAMLSEIHKAYPKVPGAGSYPLDLLQYGEAFKLLLDELRSNEFRDVIAKKFSMQLENLPTMLTVRGFARKKDGAIHTDTKTKRVTFLLYLNPKWEAQGGRLRLLRNQHNLDDVIEEIPPIEGTLLAFKVSPNSWHGHKPFVGPRRVIQMNYVANEEVIAKEMARHRFTAKIKKITNLIRW